MCVIIAKKSKLKSKKEKWFLYKIRDRDYDPNYQLEVKKKNGIEALFFLDSDSGWREGINNKGLMIVGSALANKADSENNGSAERSKKSIARTEKDHRTLEAAMMSGSVNQAAKILKAGFFQGTNFISDGDTLLVQEIYLNQKFQEKATQDWIDANGEEAFEELSGTEQLDIRYDAAKPENYDIAEKIIRKEMLVVRTNIGRLLDDAGYQKEEGEDNSNYFSSIKRYNYAYDALKNEPLESHPFDTLTILSGLDKVDSKGQYNPIRAKEELPKEEQTKTHKYGYYSSTIVMLSPAGTIFVVPLLADIDDSSRLALKPDREVDFVILPKKLHLFETLSASKGFAAFNNNKNSVHYKYENALL